MRREARKHEKNNFRTALYVSGCVILLAIIAFIIGIMMLSNKIENDAEESKLSTSKISDLVPNSVTNTQETSSEMGKTVNELKNEVEKTENEITNSNKITNVSTNINSNNSTTTTTKKTEETSAKEEVKNETTNEIKQETKAEEIKDPVFIAPVEGDIIREFAKDKLVYSETLGEWITHNGIDIKAEKTTVVKVAADGKVSSIKNDPRYGLTVVIEHDNGFQTVYANLLTAEFVTTGELVKSGQTLGTVGNTATFETLDESHLHFEIIKDGEYLDPSIYINN